MIFWVLLGCGDPPEMKKVEYEPESFSVEKEMVRSIEKSKKDLECIQVFLMEQKEAPDTWQQPEFKEYEKEGCKPMYTEQKN